VGIIWKVLRRIHGRRHLFVSLKADTHGIWSKLRAHIGGNILLIDLLELKVD
jgi:hypothetical protein